MREKILDLLKLLLSGLLFFSVLAAGYFAVGFWITVAIYLVIGIGIIVWTNGWRDEPFNVILLWGIIVSILVIAKIFGDI